MNRFFRFLAFVMPITLLSCGPGSDRVRVKGKFRNLDNAEFYVYSETGAFSGIDTIKIEGGKFSFERPCKEAEVLTFLYPNSSRTYIILEPGKTITVRSNAEHLEGTDVSGTEANERFTRFRLKNLDNPPANIHLAAAQYIRDNASHIDGLAAFIQYFSQQEQPNGGEALSLLDALKAGMPQNQAMLQLDQHLRPLLTNAVGQKVAPFAATTTEGNRVNIPQDFAGKPLLITFLASWQSESHVAAQTLNRLRRAFGSQMGYLTISLDIDTHRWAEFAQSDSVNAPVICDGLSFESPVVNTLGVRYVPGNLLVDRTGHIVGRDLERKELEHHIANLL